MTLIVPDYVLKQRQAKEIADWNCEKSGKFKNFITNGDVWAGSCALE